MTAEDVESCLDRFCSLFEERVATSPVVCADGIFNTVLEQDEDEILISRIFTQLRRLLREPANMSEIREEEERTKEDKSLDDNYPRISKSICVFALQWSKFGIG